MNFKPSSLKTIISTLIGAISTFLYKSKLLVIFFPSRALAITENGSNGEIFYGILWFYLLTFLALTLIVYLIWSLIQKKD